VKGSFGASLQKRRSGTGICGPRHARKSDKFFELSTAVSNFLKAELRLLFEDYIITIRQVQRKTFFVTIITVNSVAFGVSIARDMLSQTLKTFL
jgi:hypothetical protein